MNSSVTTLSQTWYLESRSAGLLCESVTHKSCILSEQQELQELRAAWLFSQTQETKQVEERGIRGDPLSSNRTLL